MDFNFKLIKMLHSLQSEVESIKTHLQRINPGHDPLEARQDATPVIRAELQLPPSINTEQIASGTQQIAAALHRPVWDWVKLGVEVLTLVAVITYACFTYQIMASTKRAADAAKEAAEAATEANIRAGTSDKEARRAYITRVSNGQMNISWSDKGIGSAALEIFASGSTPAFNVRRAMAWGVLTLPLSKDRPVKDASYFEPPFTFQNPEADQVSINDIVLSEQQKREITAGTHGLVVWGNIEYFSFGERHYTDFCYLIGTDLKQSKNKCPYHNNAD